MGFNTWPLTAFKVSVGAGYNPFAFAKGFPSRKKAHRTARLAPLKARSDKNFIQTFCFVGAFHMLLARHTNRCDIGVDLFALKKLGNST